MWWCVAELELGLRYSQIFGNCSFSSVPYHTHPAAPESEADAIKASTTDMSAAVYDMSASVYGSVDDNDNKSDMLMWWE